MGGKKIGGKDEPKLGGHGRCFAERSSPPGDIGDWWGWYGGPHRRNRRGGYEKSTTPQANGRRLRAPKGPKWLRESEIGIRSVFVGGAGANSREVKITGNTFLGKGEGLGWKLDRAQE